MAAFEIRPRRATELVDASFQLLRRFYPQLISVSAIAMAPGVFSRIIFRGVLGDPTAMVANPGTWIGVALLNFLCIAIADAVLIVAASEGYLDGDVDLGRALSQGWSRAGSMIAALFLRYLMVFGGVGFVAIFAALAAPLIGKGGSGAIGFVFLLVPFITWFSIYAGLRTFAVAPAVLLEDQGPLAAISRSWRLSKNCTAHTFFSLGLAWLLYFILIGIATAVGTLLLSPSLTQILTSILIIPIYPLLSIVSTLLYYDLRIRKEGFDLEVMSRDLGAATPSPIPAV